ncbi:MAG TPA: ATP-binding protein [Drouetiella sp.]
MIRMRNYPGLFMTFFIIATTIGLTLELSGLFKRQELQTINQRFETRYWLNWNEESLKRLNIQTLLHYHDKHEIPNRWWAWDYTLSWLIENNHPQVKHKFILFNHQLEDEPPPEAVSVNPWMKPLLKWPLSRASIADSLKFLAQSKVKMVILDNDFPQYSADDAILAKAIHDCDSGLYSGYKIPVLMARTVNRNTVGSVMRVEVPTAPGGIISELKKLEPNVDVLEKYTGSTGVWLDEDQVVRSLATDIPGQHTDFESIAVKAVQAMGEAKPKQLPNPMIIDYAGPPNSELYAVRPYTYLLDPERQKEMVHPTSDSGDVTLRDAVIILGDGVVDVYSTSTTNLGYNFMSGPEILANAIDTISRKSWLHKTSWLGACCWIVANSFFGALTFSIWQKRFSGRNKLNPLRRKEYSLLNLSSDLFVLLSTMALSIFAANLLFANVGLIVPMISPLVALAFGSIASIIWEREEDKIETMLLRVQTAEEKVEMLNQIHRTELEAQAAHAEAREFMKEREQRREFLHKINHDLRGPVGVLNWTIMRLQNEGLNSKTATQKLERLANSSDRLGALLDELMQSYEEKPLPSESELSTTDLNNVVLDCCKLQSSLAEERDSTLTSHIESKPTLVTARQLEISRCVDNIIRNALLHNKPGTTVQVTLSAGREFHRLTIADNGKGIDAAHLEHIFDAGYRVSQNTDSHKDGQGLGLHIVKSLIENMGGHVLVESEVDCGTKFIITLPSANAVDSTKDQSQESETEVADVGVYV